MFARGTPVAVLDRGSWVRGIVDAPPQVGWVGVSGLPGYAGVASCRVSMVSTFVHFARKA